MEETVYKMNFNRNQRHDRLQKETGRGWERPTSNFCQTLGQMRAILKRSSLPKVNDNTVKIKMSVM
jgi:hypothetical protein